jgi:hypothetical protein
MEKLKSTESILNKTVHASFRKVVSFDLLFFALGIVAGIGIGVYLIAS